MKLLLVALACRPGRGSEPGVGYETYRAAVAAGYDVTLITQRQNVASVAEMIGRTVGVPTQIIGVGLPSAVMDRWDRLGRRGFPLYCLVWQAIAAFRARSLHRSSPFDVVHQVTLQADWLGSVVCMLDSTVRVWGPIGGGTSIDSAGRRWLGWRGRCKEVLRIATTGPLRASIGRYSAKHSTLVIAVNEDRLRWLTSLGCRAIRQTQTFLTDHPEGPRSSARGVDGRYKAVFIGRLVAWKGVRLAISALAQSGATCWDLDFYGDGPERAALLRMVKRLNLAERVRFLGQVDRAVARNAGRDADALLYPSLREADSWAVAEARAVGTPIVCVAVGAYSDLPQSAGIAVACSGAIDVALARGLADIEQRGRAVQLPPCNVASTLASWYQMASERH